MHREVASGSLAAGFTATLFSPIECVKTRLQVQDQPGWPRLYRHGFVRALMQIGAEDGLLRLHNGLNHMYVDLCGLCAAALGG